MSSILHAKVTSLDANHNCAKHFNREEMSQSKKWWQETTRHISNLKTSLVKQKILPPMEKRRNSIKPTAKSIVHAFIHSTQRVDEIAARNNAKDLNIPVFPKLRLTRKPTKKDKVPCPITVTLVRFNSGHTNCINLNCWNRPSRFMSVYIRNLFLINWYRKKFSFISFLLCKH